MACKLACCALDRPWPSTESTAYRWKPLHLIMCLLASLSLASSSYPTSPVYRGPPYPKRVYSISETLAPAEAFAGEAIHVQPVVCIFDESTGMLATEFQGEVTATVASSPTSFESVSCNGVKDVRVAFYGGSTFIYLLGIYSTCKSSC
jgi:hypothetical protein